jgi:hypothetical protein
MDGTLLMRYRSVFELPEYIFGPESVSHESAGHAEMSHRKWVVKLRCCLFESVHSIMELPLAEQSVAKNVIRLEAVFIHLQAASALLDCAVVLPKPIRNPPRHGANGQR